MASGCGAGRRRSSLRRRCGGSPVWIDGVEALLRNPPGSQELGLGLEGAAGPVLALARNPVLQPDSSWSGQWVLQPTGPSGWEPFWWFRESESGALLQTRDGGVAAQWLRPARARGTVSRHDRLVVAGTSYDIRAVRARGWAAPAAGVTVADASGPLLTLAGGAPLGRDTSVCLPVLVRAGTAVSDPLWAMVLAVLGSTWDAQAAALMG